MSETDWDSFFGEEIKPSNIPSGNISERAKLSNASYYQTDILEAFEARIRQIEQGQQPRSMIVSATAGSGKTTSLIACSNLITSHVRKPVFLAFGARIASELKSRLSNTNIQAVTTHSYWRSQWSNYLWNSQHRRLETNQYRTMNFVRKLLGLDNTKIKHPKYKYSLSKSAGILARFAKQHGLVPHDYVGAEGLVEDNNDFWYFIIDFYDVDVDNPIEAIELARAALVNSLDNDDIVDFDDMLWFPAVKRINDKPINSEKHDLIIIDEVQDLNQLQRSLCHQMLSDKGFLLATGDKNQSVFSWRGADYQSMDNFEKEFDCEAFPLSICYRCGSEIVKLAQGIYPVIEPAPNAIKGEVVFLDKFNINDFLPGDLILCRNNAPTIALAYRLIRAKMPAKVVGRDIGEGLITVIKKIKSTDMIEFVEKLNGWRERQLALIERKNPDDEQAKARIEDKYSSILVFLEDPNITTTEHLIRMIESMFTTTEDEKDVLVNLSRINLSTVHKCKGGQAERVFILDRFLFNPYYARQEWQIIQENNVRFVAYTRAIKSHFFIDSKNITDNGQLTEPTSIVNLMKKSKQATKRSNPSIINIKRHLLKVDSK